MMFIYYTIPYFLLTVYTQNMCITKKAWNCFIKAD